jgi:AraC-like DNA-binding protein
MKEKPHEYSEVYNRIPTDFDKKGGIWMIRIGRNKAKINYKFGPKQIEHYSLHFIVKGQIQVEFDSKSVLLKQGDVFCLFPKRVYRYWMVDSDAMLSMFWINFDGLQASDILNKIGITRDHPYKRGVVDNKMKVDLHLCLETCKASRGEDDLLLQGLLYRIIYNMKEQLIPGRNSPALEWIEASKDYMKLHYAEQIGVADISELFGLHRSYFSSTFGKKVGVSPMQYLQDIRMQKAIELMQGSSLSATQIAYSVGYSDIYTFSRAFRKILGTSPKQYIQQFRVQISPD